MLAALADALRFLEARVATTLAGRIRERLLEALPEDAAHRLQNVSDAALDIAAR
ncbi:hypothetical protein [Pseudoxanthomonas sp.]|uniref:hypothetical protein n=1 Tax=Pseudoxanthomonas sp. TaxID=1871049 RepID=UPI0028C459BC|nr:hypothetical protein [Pseudoxanthomonas sp.]